MAALGATAPAQIYGTRLALTGLGVTATQPAMRFLNGQRGFGAPEGGRRAQLWKSGGNFEPFRGVAVAI